MESTCAHSVERMTYGRSFLDSIIVFLSNSYLIRTATIARRLIELVAGLVVDGVAIDGDEARAVFRVVRALTWSMHE